MLMKFSNLNWLIFINMSIERMHKTKYLLGIYNAKCYKLLMSSVFVVWLVREIFEPKLAYFHKYLSMEMMNKTEYVLGISNANILRQYHICIKFDNQRKML